MSTYGGTLYGSSVYGVDPPNTTQFRARNPADGTIDTDLIDVKPLRETFDRFGSGATLAFLDTDGTKLDTYPYGQRVEVQYTTDGGANWDTRLAGATLTPERTTRGGIPAVEVTLVGYNHFLTREPIVKDYSSTVVSSILKDIIETFTPITWVAANVAVQNDDSVNLNLRGETPDQAIDQLASRSANEEWGVNDDFEFVFRQRDTTRAAEVTDSDVIDYDLPTEGERAINQFTLYYGSNGSNAVTVSDREAQKDLQAKLDAPRNVVISESDHKPEITDETTAEEFARSRLGNQSQIQTGTVTQPLGWFDTSAGDVFALTIGDAGISSEDFRVAQIDYNWQEGTVERTIAENTGDDVEELLIALSDQVANERLQNADTAATFTEYLDIQSGVEASLSTSLTTKDPTADAFIVGQSDVGDGTNDTVGGGVATASISTQSTKVTRALLNLMRDLWQDGNSAFTDLTHLAVGSDDSAATVSDDSLNSEVTREPLARFDGTSNSVEIEFTATIPAGGPQADAGALQELSISDSASGGTHYLRATYDSADITATTRFVVRVVLTIDVDSDLPGAITTTGQERLVDLIIGESGHEPTDMVYGTGTTDATESDTSLESQSLEDTIDSFQDGSTGITDIVERVKDAEADTTNFSEIGYENSSDELLARLVFEAFGEDVILESNYRFVASNA